MKPTKGLTDLLVRLGMTPTFEITEDIELAKEGMSRPFNGHAGLYPYGKFQGVSRLRESFFRSPLTKNKE
jgi:hypothetical protein